MHIFLIYFENLTNKYYINIIVSQDFIPGANGCFGEYLLIFIIIKSLLFEIAKQKKKVIFYAICL